MSRGPINPETSWVNSQRAIRGKIKKLGKHLERTACITVIVESHQLMLMFFLNYKIIGYLRLKIDGESLSMFIY